MQDTTLSADSGLERSLVRQQREAGHTAGAGGHRSGAPARRPLDLPGLRPGRGPVRPCRAPRWRHLDSCQFQTYLHARIPRVGAPEHGVRNAALPWGERGSRFTLLMEKLIIAVLQQSFTLSAACRLLGISWDEAHGVMTRAVRRGLARR